MVHVLFTSENQPCYHNFGTGESSWIAPPGLIEELELPLGGTEEHFIHIDRPSMSLCEANCAYLDLSPRTGGELDRVRLAFDTVAASGDDDSDNFDCFATTCPMRYRHEGWRREKACVREIEFRSATYDPKYCEFCGRCIGDTLANGQPLRKLRKCSGCHRVRYCGTACQRAHWIRHKERCCPEELVIVGIGPTEPTAPPHPSPADHIYYDNGVPTGRCRAR